jgi:uncharacterized protein YbaR (Trm112 family)
MPVPNELAEFFVCPKCKGKLSSAADGSAYVCMSCRLSYAVEGGVPNFLVDEAKPVA